VSVSPGGVSTVGTGEGVHTSTDNVRRKEGPREQWHRVKKEWASTTTWKASESNNLKGKINTQLP